MGDPSCLQELGAGGAQLKDGSQVLLLLLLLAGSGNASTGEEALVEYPQYEEQGVFYPAKRSLTKLTDPCMLHRLTLSELFHIVKEEVTKFETCLRTQNV